MALTDYLMDPGVEGGGLFSGWRTRLLKATWNGLSAEVTAKRDTLVVQAHRAGHSTGTSTRLQTLQTTYSSRSLH